MVSIVIFWAALFAIIFFILGIVCKGLTALFYALLDTLGKFLVFGGIALFVLFALFTIYTIVDGIITGNSAGISAIIAFLVMVIVLAFLFSGLGSIILTIAIIIADFVYTKLSFVLEGSAALCEKAYIYFLKAIVNRLEKC